MRRVLKRYLLILPSLIVLLLPAAGLGDVQILELGPSSLHILYEPGEMEHRQLETNVGFMDMLRGV